MNDDDCLFLQADLNQLDFDILIILYNTMTRVLLSGGSGFIAAHVLDILLEVCLQPPASDLN